MLTRKDQLLQLSPRRMHSHQAAILLEEYTWIAGYVRHGVRVRGHWRKRPARQLVAEPGLTLVQAAPPQPAQILVQPAMSGMGAEPVREAA